MNKIIRIFLLTCLCATVLLTTGCSSSSSSHSTTSEPNDKVALAGETMGKLFFDINLDDADKLALYFDVIIQTYEGLEDQDVEPMFVIAFRGMAVTLIDATATETTKALVTEIAALPNVRLEACSIATAIFGVDNATILPEINVVGNTFISALGFQSDGYAPILIQ